MKEEAEPFPHAPVDQPGPGPEGPGDPVLLVEDDLEALQLLRDFVAADGYAVEACSHPGEALERLRERTFSCIVSDHYMPGMDGLSFLAEAAREQPLGTRILITGAASLDVAVKALNSGVVYHFLTKPWSTNELTAVLRHAVARYHLKVENQELHRRTVELNKLLESANRSLRENFDRSLELCRNLMGTFSPLLDKSTRSVEAICRQFCGLGLMTEEEEKVMMVGATLQNIGLIGIPRELLQTAFQRPQRLTDEQRILIEKHPLYGETLIQFVGQLTGVAETIRAHHERWDGGGYPDGLREEAIPMPARFLAVACRFVESGLPAEEAFQQIQSESNRAFYPEAVRAFSKVFQGAKLPRKVKEITFNELRPGMVLAKSLHSPSGLLLMSEGKAVRRDLLEKIRNHSIMDHVNDPILVYL
jgi:response regulator RpfG family c-di-GMP phosphodiesterase